MTLGMGTLPDLDTYLLLTGQRAVRRLAISRLMAAPPDPRVSGHPSAFLGTRARPGPDDSDGIRAVAPGRGFTVQRPRAGSSDSESNWAPLRLTAH